jgi:hypothetical protein
VRGCEDCVIEMEDRRARAAERHGWPYQPGCLAGE